VPIGRPIDNVTLYVVDDHGRPQPIGVEGELMIGGVALARGYLNAPELTAQRFVADHLDPAPGARLYRTGDRARWNSDGELEFLGRADQQVKLRGLRLELQEIETVILELSIAAEAAVAVRGEAESAFLVGYLVGRADLDDEQVIQLLAEKLPMTIVPQVLVGLDRLPLSANGKLDRSALPEPDFGRPAAGVTLTPSEQLLAGIWTEVIGVAPQAGTDSFFSLGGTSLALAQVAARLSASCGVDLTLAMLLGRHTLAAAAAQLDSALAARRRAEVDGRAPADQTADARVADDRASDGRVADGRPVRFPASGSQRRIWAAQMIAGASELYNVPLLLRLTGELDERALASAWHQLQRRHPMLRATIADTAGELIVSVHPEPLAELAVRELGGLDPGEERAARQRLIDSSGEQRFDLASGPLGSATLIRLAPASFELMMCWHHLIVDARTLDLLCRDLRALYLAAADSTGCAASTGGPASGASYRAFAEAERQAAVDAGPELAWWVDEIADVASFAPTSPTGPTGPQASADSRIQQLQLGKHLRRGRACRPGPLDQRVDRPRRGLAAQLAGRVRFPSDRDDAAGHQAGQLRRDRRTVPGPGPTGRAARHRRRRRRGLPAGHDQLVAPADRPRRWNRVGDGAGRHRPKRRSGRRVVQRCRLQPDPAGAAGTRLGPGHGRGG